MKAYGLINPTHKKDEPDNHVSDSSTVYLRIHEAQRLNAIHRLIFYGRPPPLPRVEYGELRDEIVPSVLPVELMVTGL